MSQRRTRGNPNPRGTVNVQPPPVSIPNESNPQPAVENPNSMTTLVPAPASSNPTANLPPTQLLLLLLEAQILQLLQWKWLKKKILEEIET